MPINDLNKATDEFWETAKDVDTVISGITSIYQVPGMSDIKFDDLILNDFSYVENQTMMFDIENLFHTVSVALLGDKKDRVYILRLHNNEDA